MRIFKFFMLAVGSLVLGGALFGVCHAQEVVDSTGVLQTLFVSAIKQRFPILAPFAGYIYSVIAAAIGATLWKVVQSILKRVPTKWKWSAKAEDVAVSKVWTGLTWLFGKSILFYKMKIEADEDKEALAKQAAIDKFKKHLLKHDPILSIDINKIDKS